jgi:UDP-2,4-diacetamido-2,4,6-trideoxy-beta-L-altropyranose hydrolase
MMTKIYSNLIAHTLPKLGHVAIRVDANPDIGMGHLRRCLTLGKQLRADGFIVQLICRSCYDKNVEKLVKDFNVSFFHQDETSYDYSEPHRQELWDAEATLSIIGSYPSYVSWVIVDSYQLSELWEKTIAHAGHKILAIDDFRNRPHYADLLLSDTSNSFSKEMNGNKHDFYELLGSKYTLVDLEYAFIKEPLISLVKPKRILISYGGCDPTDETNKALKAIYFLRNHKRYQEYFGIVDVVVGQVNTKADMVIRSAGEIDNVNVHLAPGSLANFLRKADIFLTAGGNSMVEALTMRKPCLVTVTSDNQALMVNQLVEKSAITSLGGHGQVSSELIANALIEICTKYEQIFTRCISQSIFDHLGANRVSIIMQSISRDKIDSFKAEDMAKNK